MRRSEDQYKLLFQTIVQGVVYQDNAGRIILMNPAAERILGRSRGEFVGLTSVDTEKYTIRENGSPFPGMEHPSMVALLTGREVRDVCMGVYNPREKRYRWIDINAVPLFRPGEANPYQVYTSFHDITEEKQAKDALRQALEQRRLALESAQMGAWDYRYDTGEVFWDERCRNLFGLSEGERIDYASALACVHQEDCEAVDLAVRQAIAGACDGLYRQEFRVVWPDGSVHWIESHGRAYFEGAGEERRAVRFTGVAADVTERHEEEMRLRQAQKLESIGYLAGGIAHEFNNLLTTVIGYASIVAEQVPAELADAAKAILSGAERAAFLTRQLLAYSGKGAFRREELNVSRAIRDIAELLKVSVPGTLDLEVEIEEPLPPVRMDAGQLQQVLTNLVINASEAIGEERRGVVAVSARPWKADAPVRGATGERLAAGTYVCLAVRDDGPGMEESVKARIFDPFFSTKFAGRGLGLAAVSGIVRSQGGAITVESGPGEGATFRVFFPAAGGGAPHPSRR